MRRLKKRLSLTLIVTFIFSIIRLPMTVQAAELNTAPIKPLKPGTFTGVTAELSDSLKVLPSTMTYNMKLMDLPELIGKEINIVNSTNTISGTSNSIGGLQINTPKLANNLSDPNTAIDVSKVDRKDLKYPVGANLMILDKNSTSFAPVPGEIYIDKTNNTAMKVLESPKYDSKSGKRVVPVVKPQFNEIFKSYKIPEQTVKLNKANIGYVRPTAADEDGESYINIEQVPSKPNIIIPRKPILGATHIADTASLLPVDVDTTDDALVITIKNVTIYEYPEPPKDEKDKEDEKKAGSEDYNPDEEGDPGYYESKDGTQPDKQKEESNLSNDLKGVEEKDTLTVKVKIEDAKLTIHKPEAFANVDIGLLEQKIEVGYQSEIESEINIKGEMKFNKVIETCIFGYDIDIPYGRAFIGVFLVIDAKGEVTVKTKIVTNSLFKAGLKAQAYVFVPVYVGPFAGPEIKSINAGFSADGEIQAKAAIVPQVGLEICDLEIGVLQLWLALTANAKFHIEGNAGVSVDKLSADGDIKGEGSLKLGAYAEFVGYLFGGRYSLFYKDWTLYEGSWAVGQEARGSEGDARPINGTVSVAADAFDNSIQGIVSYYDPNGDKSVGGGNLPRGSMFVVGTPLKDDKVDIFIQHNNGVVEQPITVNTDNFGYFEVPKAQRREIKPTDVVYAKVNTTVKDSTGEIRKLTEKSVNVVPTIPFDEIHFVADAFNDVVRGTVSGKYTSESNEKYNGYVQIEKISKTDPKKVSVKVEDGSFYQEMPLVGGESVKVILPFEGVNFPLDAGPKPASLDALKIRFKKPASGIGLSEVEGTVQNMAEDMYKSYRGNVTIKTMSTPYQVIGSGNVVPGTSRMAMPDKSSPSGLSMKTVDTGTSTFKIPITPSVKFTINIEHDGIVKKIGYDPLGELFNKLKNIELEKEVTNPVEDKTNPVVNPADNWKGVWEFEQLGTVVLDVVGTNISGTYNAGECSLKAQVSGDKLVGTLYEYGEEYKVEFYMPQDGKTFRGTWYDGGQSHNFKGSKLKLPFSFSTKVVTPEDLTNFTGIWYTDYGTALFNQEDSKVTGSYDSNRYSISGTVSGRMLRGTFTEGGNKGEIEFELLPDGLTFEGRYRPEGGGEWTPWNGTRHAKSKVLQFN